MDLAHRTPAIRPFFRFLAWVIASVIAIGLIALSFVFAGEEMILRERIFFAALFACMAISLWAFVRAARSRETAEDAITKPRGSPWWGVLIAVYAAGQLVVLGVMIEESRSVVSWGGLLVFANLAGCALYLFGRRAFSGR